MSAATGAPGEENSPDTGSAAETVRRQRHRSAGDASPPATARFELAGGRGRPSVRSVADVLPRPAGRRCAGHLAEPRRRGG